MENLNFELSKKWKDTKLGLEFLGNNDHELVYIPDPPSQISKELKEALEQFTEEWFKLEEQANEQPNL